ncbi:4-hydroxy-2-oxoheptanedioate aldolase [Microvirga sp. TS319]|uniref:4-hydroxy-2-oxoheptanedioate aldolase n=1 Tax=Microvirga sp. TS319 TaxID=3241165 RepID=UPI003519F360
MPAPQNAFKAALRNGRSQIGLWLALASPYVAEVCAGAGYDWLLVDAEHGPNDIPLLAAQLQAIAGSASHPVVRVPIGETWIIKQVLDIGAQTLLVPMVESAEQARALVRATRYPPDGVRGVGAALARASNYNRISDYLQTANEQICLLVQVESRAGLAAIEEIASVDGVDGIFIGPADLAADMGHLGVPGVADVQSAVRDGLSRILASGKAAGILTADVDLAQSYVELGASFVAIGSDVGVLAGGATRLLSQFAAKPAAFPTSSGAVY